jgi:hypothetical protein
MASADVRIISDPGGEVLPYLRTFYEMRAGGERVVIDGPCLSACTLLTGIVPRNNVCVSRRAVLDFHAASYYNGVSRSLMPTRAGARFLMRLYTAGEAGVNFDTKLIIVRTFAKRIYEAIEEQSRQWPANLIVVATEGGGGFSV